MAAEKAGIPAVSVLATAFMAQGRAFAKGLGVADPAIAEYPGVPMVDSDEQLYQKVIDQVVPKVLEGWARPQGKAKQEAGEPHPRDIVYKGTLDQIQEYFEAKLWS